ncbi:GntR family transcriptional regulator [Microbacterium sp. MMO-113]|uniref:GntR family transcriptional regulator n=1 Tax=Microbacterium sp. MMO-113 TaxID=3081273 RepID=UPI00301726D5
MDATPSESGSTLHTHAVDSRRRAAALGDGNRVLSRTQKVYVALRDDIVRTRLAPGEVVIEPELAARFGVSKTPVREALQILVVEGLVVALPRRGYVVRPLGINEVREVLDLRLIIEPPMAAGATRYGNEAFVEELSSILEAQRSGSGTAELTDAARAFHECILGAARNVCARPRAATCPSCSPRWARGASSTSQTRPPVRAAGSSSTCGAIAPRRSP